MIKNVLFDFDGTLADTSEGIIKSMHYAYDCMGYEHLSDEEIRVAIGPPLQEMFRQLAGIDDDAEIEMCVNFFRERYSKEGVTETELYPHVQEGLAILREAGKRLFIVSSKPEVFVKQIGRRYHIAELFDGISAVPITGTAPSKTVRMGSLMKEHGMSAEDTVMVGDRHEDTEAAVANGIRCIGAAYGFDEAAVLRSCGCWKICDSFRKICELILA